MRIRFIQCIALAAALFAAAARAAEPPPLTPDELARTGTAGPSGVMRMAPPAHAGERAPAVTRFRAAQTPSGQGTHRAAPSVQPAIVSASPAPEEPPSANPRRWLIRPVSFAVEDQSLARLLREFASAQGVSCQVSDQIRGTVTGTFSFPEPGELLDILSRAQHFNWYFDGAVAHFFSNSEMETRLLPLEGKREESLRAALVELELHDPRFGWRTSGDGRLLLVQGPSTYLDRISDVLERQIEIAAQATAEKRLEVFRLNHAWASDRSITVGDGSVAVPGVVSVLRQILSNSPPGTGSAQSAAANAAPTLPGQARKLSGSGAIGQERAKQETAAAKESAPAASAAAGDTAFIQADDRLNAVLVWDRENMPRHRAVIETLDQPLALVEIRAAILDVETDRSRELGINWEFRNRSGRWSNDAGANMGSGVDFRDALTGDGLQYATIYTKGLNDFMARVSALEEDGSANILSRPSVLTQDNTQASLEHSETFYVKLEGYQEVDLAEISSGMTLRVTPHIIDEGAGGIQLSVFISNGSGSYDQEAQVDNLPRVRQSVISTQAVVHEGEALIIGGYYNETRQETDSGVPILKNVPGLGALFRTRGKTATKSERLFALSPRIVYPGSSPIGSGTEAERMMEFSPAKKTMDGSPLPEVKKPGSFRFFRKKNPAETRRDER